MIVCAVNVVGSVIDFKHIISMFRLILLSLKAGEKQTNATDKQEERQHTANDILRVLGILK